MNCLLDSHFLIWITLESRRLRRFPWLGKYLPRGVSPISHLELQYLAEIGRLQVDIMAFTDLLLKDRRFVVDEAPLMPLVRHAFRLDWTRDPFDRFLAAHSALRRLPLCTVDRTLVVHHPLLPAEISG